MNNYTYSQELAALDQSINELQSRFNAFANDPYIVGPIKAELERLMAKKDGILRRINTYSGNYAPNPNVMRNAYESYDPRAAAGMYQQPTYGRATYQSPVAPVGANIVNPRYSGNPTDYPVAQNTTSFAINAQSAQTEKQEEIPLTPLEGYEFPLLLKLGYTAKKVQVGDYYRYDVEIDPKYAAAFETILSDYNADRSLSDTVSLDDLTKTLVYKSKDSDFVLTTVRKQGVIYDTMSEELVSDFFKRFNYLEDHRTAKNIIEFIRTFSAINPCQIGAFIDNLLVKRFVGIARSLTANTGFNITNFLTDYDDVEKMINENVKSVAKKTKYRNALNSAFKFGMACIKTFNVNREHDDKETELGQNAIKFEYYIDEPTIVIMANNVREDIEYALEKNNMLGLTSDSYPELHQLLSEFKNDNTLFNDTGVCQILLPNCDQTYDTVTAYVSKDIYVITK